MNYKKKIRVLILSYYFPPAGGGGVQRILNLIKYLPPDKYELTILTAKDPGLQARDPFLYNSFGEHVKIYPIDSPIPHTILSAFHTQNKNNSVIYETSALKRWLGAFFFVPDTRKKWAKEVLSFSEKNEEEFRNKFDFILATLPPYSTALVARKLSKKFGIPFILDFRDGWRFHPFQIFPTPFHRMWHSVLERKSIENAAVTVFTSDTLKQKMKDEYPHVPSIRNAITIYNGFDPEKIDAIQYEQDGEENGILKIGIPGTIYFTATRPLILLDALKKYKNPGSVQFLLMGKWTKKFEQKIHRKGLGPWFQFKGYLPHDHYVKALTKCDAHFLFLEPVPNIEYVIPGRFFELMVTKIPLIVFGPEEHEIKRIIKKYELPVGYEPYSTDRMEKVLLSLRDMLPIQREKISQYDFEDIYKDFARPNQVRLWDHLFESILKKYE